MAGGRRELFGLVGATFLLTACGGSTSTPIKAVASLTSSAAATSPAGSSAASTSATVPAAASSAANSTPVVRIGGPEVPAAKAISVSDAQRIAAEANGRWRGRWRDSAGNSGTTEVTVAINGARRTAQVTVAIGGSMLGSPVADQAYEVDLMSFLLAADSYDLKSPQFGDVSIVPGGGAEATASAGRVPGHPEIDTLQVEGSRTGRRVDVTYRLHHVDGSTVTGTMAWSSSGVAAPAALPAAGGPPNPADVQSGTYAAGLLTGAELTTIFGKPVPAPETNGGRLSYDIGVDISNAVALGAGYTTAYSVLIGRTAALTKALWGKQLLGLPDIAGSWKAAFWLAAPPTLYVYATDTRVLRIMITPATDSGVPTAAQQRTWRGLCEKVASKLVAALSER